MDNVIQVLSRWYFAHKMAEDNPAQLLAAQNTPDYEFVSAKCGATMRACKDADDALFALERSRLPTLVLLFLRANDDKGCNSCWLSSSHEDTHIECERKIAEWFGFRDALMVFIKQVYLRPYPGSPFFERENEQDHS